MKEFICVKKKNAKKITQKINPKIDLAPFFSRIFEFWKVLSPYKSLKVDKIAKFSKKSENQVKTVQ